LGHIYDFVWKYVQSRAMAMAEIFEIYAREKKAADRNFGIQFCQ
jgi:hypothetical protein